MKKKSALLKQFHADLAALAAYEPRKRAIQWILDGDFDAYLDWVDGDGFYAAHGEPRDAGGGWERLMLDLLNPMPLDRVLTQSRLGEKASITAKIEAARLASQALDHFDQSPFEIALRAADDAAFAKLLSLFSSPTARYLRGSSNPLENAGWMRLGARMDLEEDEAGSRLAGDFGSWGMLILPFLVGKPDRASWMVKAGLAPDSQYGWADFAGKAEDYAKVGPALLSKIVGSDDCDPAKAAAWGWERMELVQKLEEAAGQAELHGKAGAEGEATLSGEEFDRVALELVEQGSPIDYYTLAAATELGRLDLLSKLFEAGADPNILYKSGERMLARMDDKSLTPEAVAVWMKAGARPTLDQGCENPFIDGWSLSPLMSFAWKGRVDLLKACAEHAQGPVCFTQDLGGGRVASDLLAVAIDKGREDAAAWLVEEKGCRLDHIETQNGKPIRGLAKGQMLDRLVAIEERLALTADPLTTTDKDLPRDPGEQRGRL